MASPLNPELSPIKRALLEILDLRARLDAVERASREPVAVIGIGLRFPGASDPETFWEMLQAGTNAVSEVPPSRWNVKAYYDPDPAAPGKMYVRHGGFLDRVDAFDAGFFGIRPREATTMDPQQRLLLEVAWEALENAAQAPSAIAESAAGVFVGMATSDYQRLLMADAERIDTYTGTGASPSIAAGRLSYLLGLNGPSLVVDTACSSSLVAVHLACQSLRQRECRMALAGGVNLMLAPENTVALCKSRMLAPDGRCKAFDESADGFVRAEGCGVVVLKRLADALADGDHVHAVIRGSAVNQDGRSGGLTVPSGPAQEAVIRVALADAGIDATDLSYVEAHGTGTSLGDPIEVHALISALCKDRGADRPLLVGSVKTNLGHLEAAAGIAGLIKTILAIEHGTIPPHLHLTRLNPHIHLGDAPLRVSTVGCPWPPASPRRIAGVSSFGFSGTNAHVIVEGAPAPASPAPLVEGRHTLMLSARSLEALTDLARRYASWFQKHPQLSPADVCFTAATGRKLFEHRAAWTAASLDELRRKLEAFAEGAPSEPWPEGEAIVSGRRVPLPTYPFERSRYWIEQTAVEPWPAATGAAKEQALRIATGFDISSYGGKWKTLDELTTGWILKAFEDLGIPLHPGETHRPEALLQDAAILPAYHRLALRWLHHLSERGLCAPQADGSFVMTAAAGPALEDLLPAAARQFEDDSVLLEYVESCGRQLANILQGRQSPLETLFPKGDSALAERLYERSPVSLYFNSIAAAAAEAASRGRTKGCRIIEVGAGTGATTAAVLPRLRGERLEYWFTDVSNLFSSRARRKFATYPFVHYGLFDAERDPAEQGYEPGTFDVVLATNVLHATADLPRTLAHIRSLLSPGGLLVLCEATEYLSWFDITTALIEGWQRFDDGIRLEHPLLTAETWKNLLLGAGFEDVQAFPEQGAPTEVLGQHVLLALAPAYSGVREMPESLKDKGESQFRDELQSSPTPQRHALVTEFVRQRIATILGVESAAALPSTQRMMDLGLDSLMALELREALERGLRLEGRISSTLVFDYPTIDAIATHLEGEIFGTSPEPKVAPRPAAAASQTDAVAIIGAGCRLPGGADDLDAFWTLLANGTDAVAEVPRDRWNIDDWYDPDPDVPGKMATRWGGFIHDVDRFDPEFFGISPREAESMDPQQRLLLEVSWEALENAAQHPGRLGESRTGVFVGLTSDDYGRLLSRDADLSCLDTYYASGVARSVAAGRISYVLGLQGPNVSIDTACSSSLVAVHQACQSLRTNECRMALAGGANVILLPETGVALSRAHMMAPDGRCKAFDDSADGFVRAEGCIILVLKRLSDALEDRDRILAVIRGSAVNQDGRSSGLTVPNGPAQEAVIRDALQAAGVLPADVDYVEAHGTGTALGDPIEVHALVGALGEGRGPENPLRIGSAKTNLGHLEAAAGAVGVLKAALALEHREIPPSLHFRRWNRNINLKGVPVLVPVEPTPWTTGSKPRIAGVSSFGFSGTNAHIILEEAPLPAVSEPASGVQVLKLSARSAAGLRRLAERYCEYFDKNADSDLAGICYTAAACRAAFSWKLEVRAESVAEMGRRLREAAATGDFTQAPVEPAAEEAAPRQKLALPLTPFERQRYWRPGAHKNAGAHPLLGRRLSSPVLTQTVFEISMRDWPEFLRDHRVRGKAVLPMAAYLEIFLAASDALALEDVLVTEPLELAGSGTVQVVVGSGMVQLFRRDGDDWKLHASARIAEAAPRPAPLDLPELRSRVSTEVTPQSQYDSLKALGIDLGPAFQLIRELWSGENQALGCTEIPSGASEYRAHPALIDAWVQVLGAAVRDAEDVYLPLGIDHFALYEQPAGELWSSASIRPDSGDTLIADIRVVGARGRLVASMQGLRLRKLTSGRGGNCLYKQVWRKTDDDAVHEARSKEGKWLLLADKGGVGLAVASELQKLGAACLMVESGAPSRDELSDPELQGVLHLRALDAPLAGRLDAAELARSQQEILGSVLETVRLLAGRKDLPPQLFLVTRGAQSVDESPVEPAQAPLWGMGRSIRVEHPELRSVLVDLDPMGREPAQTLLREILRPDGETQVAWRGGARMAARLVPAEGDCVRLEVASRGSLEHLQPGRTMRRRPGRGEVEIRVAAAGLNFRDVLNALDLYPGDPGPLGAECAGYVVAVGEGVHEFSVGDAVVAIAKGSMSSYVTADTGLVAARPAGLSMEDAAALPVAYVTARYALHTLGAIQAGERVLIHSACGGVGLAAIAEAQRVGAEVFATAGTEEKREYLRSLGIAHVMSSRTPEYRAEILKQTAGKGVDVVLNSLGGDFIASNLDALADGGRYLEIGKNGIWEPSRVAKYRPDVGYFVIDWGEDYERAPETVTAVFRQLMRDAEAGQVKPLPCRRYTLGEAPAAFRWMSQARHIGKIVLSPLPVREDGAYLITGGLSGLGLRVAEWLVLNGARELALAGRSAPDEEAQGAIRRMEARGARITVNRADVSRREELQSVMQGIGRRGIPLKGIIHAAGVLDNAVLLQQDAEKLARVLAPKVEGAWNLHELAAGLDLDFFVLFSSVASLLGAAGQANHASANCFLDALAHFRKSRGLPAVSINWGPWRDIGAAAGARASSHLAGKGIGSFSPAQGLDVFELALLDGRTQFAAIIADWREAQKALRLDQRYVSEIAGAARTEAAAVPDLLGILTGADASRTEAVLLEEVRRRACAVLGLAPKHLIDPDRPLSDLGLDSLMAVELRNALSAAVARPLPSTLIFSYPSIAAIAKYLAGLVEPRESDPPEPAPQDFLDLLEQLSDSEVERLLNEATERVS